MTEPHDFQQVRKEYEDHGIRDADLLEHPIELFRQWYRDAVDNRPAEWLEPNAMSLATCDQAGIVTNRYLLMKGIEPAGIRFFTNYDSRKGQQLRDNARAAAAFHWPYLGRQVRIEGEVEFTTPEVSDHYFHSRPRGSQLSAATSPQSQRIDSRAELEQRVQQLDRELGAAEVPVPDRWGGYLIRADRIEFWQGRPDRLHDRVVYQQHGGDWSRQRLAP